MKLISHADDLGLKPAIDTAILAATQAGYLTQVSAMVTHSTCAYTLPATVNCALHFNITEGTPLSDPKTIPTLVNREGSFFGLGILLVHLHLQIIDPDDIARELTAQLERFKTFYGHYPSHLDSHQHIHLNQRVGGVVVKVASLCGVQTVRAARTILFPKTAGYTPRIIKHMLESSPDNHMLGQTIADILVDPRYLTRQSLPATLASLPSESTVELIWHISTDPTDTWRARQQAIITNPQTWSAVHEASIELAQYT